MACLCETLISPELDETFSCRVFGSPHTDRRGVLLQPMLDASLRRADRAPGGDLSCRSGSRLEHHLRRNLLQSVETRRRRGDWLDLGYSPGRVLMGQPGGDS